MIRRAGAPTILPPMTAPGGGRRNVETFSDWLTPDVPSGCAPVPADVETLQAEPRPDKPFEPGRPDVALVEAQSDPCRGDAFPMQPFATVLASTADAIARTTVTQDVSAGPPDAVATVFAGMAPQVATVDVVPAAVLSSPSSMVGQQARSLLVDSMAPTGSAIANAASHDEPAPSHLRTASLVPEAVAVIDAGPSRALAEHVATAALADLDHVRAGTEQVEETLIVPSFVASDAAQGVVEVHVRTQDGNVEVVAFPWHLSANNQLSWSSTDVDVGSAVTPTTARTMQSVTAGPRQLVRDQPRTIATWFASERDADAIATAPLQHAAEDTTLSSGASPGSTTAHPLPGAMWASRLVRWLEQHGRDAELWIRDFSLDDVSARTLANDIERVLRQQGIHLDRIIVNAREQWTAAARTSTGDA